MLNYCFKTFYPPHLLFLFYTLLIQVHQLPIVILDTLACEKYKYYAIPIFNSSINTYSIQIQFGNQDSLSMLSISNSFPSLLNIGKLTPEKVLDTDSLLLNKKVQSLYFTSFQNQSQFFLFVQRITITLLNYSFNSDRTSNFLRNCPQVSFRITISDLSTILFWENGVKRLPQFRNQCVSGIFDSEKQTCQCYQDYYMRLCDTSLKKIEKIDQITRKSTFKRNYDYYFFKPNSSLFDQRQSIIVSIYIQGSSSSKYKYNDSNKFPDFVIFWNIQKSEQKLQVASYFTQQNPSLTESILIRQNQVLVLTVYKPEWSVQEEYTIHISSQPILSKQILIIIVSISVGITLLLSFFLFYVFYVKNGRPHRFYNPRGMGFGQNKISNDFFPIEIYFPSISYKQFKQSIWLEGELGENLCCICLDQYGLESEIRSTYCLHIFHADCLGKWVQKQKSCPLCRQSFSEEKLGAAQEKVSSIEKYQRIWRGEERTKKVKKLQITFEGESNYNIQNISGQNSS